MKWFFFTRCVVFFQLAIQFYYKECFIFTACFDCKPKLRSISVYDIKRHRISFNSFSPYISFVGFVLHLECCKNVYGFGVRAWLLAHPHNNPLQTVSDSLVANVYFMVITERIQFGYHMYAQYESWLLSFDYDNS